MSRPWARSWANEPGRAEAIGHGCARQGGEIAERGDAEPLERLGQLGRRSAGVQQVHGQRRELAVSALAVDVSARRGRALLAAASAQKRDGPAPIRAGRRTVRRAAARTPLEAAVEAQQPARLEAREPGALGLHRGADRSTAASTSSHASTTPTGSGGTSASAGQRASASPSRIPARTP